MVQVDTQEKKMIPEENEKVQSTPVADQHYDNDELESARCFVNLEKIIKPEELELGSEDDEIKEVIEKYKNKRADLLRTVFLRLLEFRKTPLVLKALNLTPYLGEVLLFRGAYTGKEGGRMLSKVERFNYVAATIAGILGWVEMQTGDVKIGTIAVTASYAFVYYDIFINMAKSLKEKSPGLSSFVVALGEYVGKKKDKILELTERMIDDPDEDHKK